MTPDASADRSSRSPRFDLRTRLAQGRREGLRAIRSTWRPFLAIQILAFAVAIGYAFSPAMQKALVAVAEFRDRNGLPFAAISTLLASLILSEGAKAITRQGTALKSAKLAIFYCLFFAAIGSIVFELYAGLSVLFGQGTDVATLAKKVGFDQFIFTPIIAIPLSSTAFAYRDAGFDLHRLKAMFAAGELPRRYVATILTAWSFWGPILIAVYAMPNSLQFPLFLVCQGAWALLLGAIGDPETNAGASSRGRSSAEDGESAEFQKAELEGAIP